MSVTYLFEMEPVASRPRAHHPQPHIDDRARARGLLGRLPFQISPIIANGEWETATLMAWHGAALLCAFGDDESRPFKIGTMIIDRAPAEVRPALLAYNWAADSIAKRKCKSKADRPDLATFLAQWPVNTRGDPSV